jgi:dGTPase
MTEQRVSPVKGGSFRDFDRKMAGAVRGESPLPMTMEACLVRVADTVSYIGRDIEDAIAIGIISRNDLPGDVTAVLGDTNGKIVYALVEDLITHSSGEGIVYSPEVFEALLRLKAFNYEKIYTNEAVKRESDKIRAMYSLVFGRLVEDVAEKDEASPIFPGFLNRLSERYTNTHSPFEMVRDYIAGLTDSAFLRLFHELFVPRMA